MLLIDIIDIVGAEFPKLTPNAVVAKLGAIEKEFCNDTDTLRETYTFVTLPIQFTTQQRVKRVERIRCYDAQGNEVDPLIQYEIALPKLKLTTLGGEELTTMPEDVASIDVDCVLKPADLTLNSLVLSVDDDYHEGLLNKLRADLLMVENPRLSLYYLQQYERVKRAAIVDRNLDGDDTGYDVRGAL